jgi:ABC-2 type transport system ATP-binding protein
MKSLIHRQFRQVVAVEGATFTLRSGEIVGFLGPNGAGKTTTLKMLSGLLYPDSGKVEVLGFVPSKRQRAFLKRIGLVTGNRSSMAWDLPALDSFLLLKALYEIPSADFTARRDEFIEALDLGDLVEKPIRNLSLGERMKVELVGSLLHRPEVLFLDEPTLGLDVAMQRRLRQLISDYSTRYGAAVLLTSHYMADVAALCPRVMVIDRGRLHYDGALAGLVQRFATHKTITVTGELAGDLSGFGEVVDRKPGRASIRVAPDRASSTAARLLSELTITDLTIEDPPLEEVIEQVFASVEEKPA